MKTKVKKLRFIAKIARNIACIAAFCALSASAEDTRTLGYATSGAAAELPAAPDMGGTVVNVTAAQAQYVLDGAYGSINGKTINFTESINDTLILGRASKYDGSKTVYRHGSHAGEALSYADFIAYKNQATWTEGCYYERTVENVTFTADAGVIVNFTAEGGAHVYGTESAPVYDYVRDTGTWTFDTNNGFYKRAILKNITFKGLTFKAKTDFNTSESTTVFDGFTFTGCTFEMGSTAAGNYALRYYNENNNGSVKNLVVENCTFRNCYQGVYTHHVKGITVKDSEFETTGHNAIAIQGQGGEKGACDHGAVVITGNTFKNIGDRIIRFNMVGVGTTITIADNTADGNSGRVDSATGKREIVKAESLPENAAEIIMASNNDWGVNAVAGGVFADTKPVAATIGTVSYETLDAAIAAVKDGETVVVNAGEYKLTGSQSLYTGKAFTIKAAEGATVSFDMSTAVTLGGAKITFEGVTFDYKTNNNYTGLQHADTLVYNDCTINGKVFLYAASETFNRCVFNQSAVDYNVWTYGAQKVAFNACTFNCAGKSVLVYTEKKDAKTDLTVASCKFKASAEATGKAAIEINTEYMTDGGASVTIDGETTATGFATGSNSGSTLWNDKRQTKATNKNVTVTVAGETVFAPVVAKIGEAGYSSLSEAIAAAKAGDTVTLLADVNNTDYTVANVIDIALKSGVTLDGNGKTLKGNVKVTVDPAGGVTIKNILFRDIHNAAIVDSGAKDKYGFGDAKVGTLSAVYAPKLSDSLTVTGCTFENCDWEALQITPAQGAKIDIRGNIFKTSASDLVMDQLRHLHIEMAYGTGFDYEGTDIKITVTDNQFFGGAKDAAAGIWWVGKTSVLALSGNYYAEPDTVSITLSDGKNRTNRCDLIYPARSQADVDEDDLMASALVVHDDFNASAYSTLAEAVKAAKNGETVTLLDDTVVANVVLSKSLTLDLNGKTVSSESGAKVLTVTAGTITIKNGTLQAGTVVNANSGSRYSDPAIYVTVGQSATEKEIALTLENMTVLGIENQKRGVTTETMENLVAGGMCKYEVTAGTAVKIYSKFDTSITVNVKNSTICGGKGAATEGTVTEYLSGGANQADGGVGIYARGENLTLNIMEGSRVFGGDSDNKNAGKALDLQKCASVVISDSTVQGGNGYGIAGSAVYSSRVVTAVTVENSTLKGGDAQTSWNGAGIELTSESPTITIKDSTVIGGQGPGNAKDPKGYAIDSNSATTTDKITLEGDVTLKANDKATVVRKTALGDPGFTLKDATVTVAGGALENVTVAVAEGSSQAEIRTSGETATVDVETVVSSDDTKTLSDNGNGTFTFEACVARVTAADGSSRGYLTFIDALAAAADGETVTLLADVTEDVMVATSVTLDLGGKTLSNAGASKVTLTIAEGKTVTVKNGSIVGGASNYTIKNNGTATFEDVTATAGNVGSSMLDNFGTLTINSGNYSGGMNVVKSEEGSTLLITGGTFTLGYASSVYTAVILVYGDTTIMGGTFIQNATGKWINAQVVMTGVVDGYTSITRVKGGTFVNNATRATCKIFHGTGNATSDNFEVSGGTFNKSISDGFCSAGFIPKANGDGTFGVKEGAYVAAIGSTKYETLSAALAAAKAGKTVTLLADVTEDVMVATSVTLDLGGKTLTNAGVGKATLTIAEGATVTVKNGGIVGGASYYAIQNNGTATFEDVTATAGNVGSSMLDNVGTLTINSGTYVGGMNTVKNEPKATLTINGGTFENSYGENSAHTGVIYNLGHVAITGGELTQKATGPLWAGPHVVMTDWDGSNKPSVTITGGTFTSVWTSYRATVINDAGNGTAGCTTVSGGTFNKKVPENYCAAGFIPTANDDGTFGVKEGAYVAEIGTAKYETLEVALAAAQDGETVKMLAGVTVADATTVNGKAVTLDLGGKTLTSSTTASALMVASDASLTVVDSVGGGCVKATGKYSNGIENKGCLIVEAGNFEAVYGAIRALGGSTTTINGGTFASSSGRYGLYYWANGTALSVTVNNGVFTHAVSTAMESGKVSLSVKGGSFANDLTAFCTDKDYGTFLDAATNLYVYDRKSAHQPDSYVVDEDGNVTIADEAALIWFARQVNEEGNTFKGKTVKLQADVTLTKTWTPVGVSVAKSFRGVFDGDGHTISGMRVAGGYQEYGLGFFKTVVSATVKNVTFANAEVKGAFSNIVGLVVGYSYGSSVFEDVHVTGSTVYAFGKVGGLVGYAEDRSVTTTFKGCSVSATTIHGGYNVAGFCGLVQGRCEVRGSILKGIETIIDEDAQGFGKVVELDTTVVCDGSVATCAGKGMVIKGKYIPSGGYYWSAWSDLYNHYGDSSHDCTLADGKLLANSEVVHDMPVEIGDVKYSDLQAAFDAAQKGDTVTLLSDITLTEQVNITKALDGLTLDGNGKTITCATTDDPLKSGGSALYFGNASDHLYCTGIAIKNLTMTGTARFAIFLCGGTSTTFTNVKISGNYYIAINLYGTHGATMTDCDISNGMTGTDKYISAIWSNVASANPLTLNNTKVNVIAINKYEAANKLVPKIYVNAGSTVAEIHTYDDGEFSGDTRLCVGASPVMPSVKVYDETSKTWIDAPSVVFVKALIEGVGNVTLPDALLGKVAGETRAEKVANLSKADANGNLAWVNLVAGIDPAKTVTMAAPQNNEPNVIDITLPAVGATPEGTDVAINYEIRAEGSEAAVASATAAEDLAINLNGKASIGTYRAYVRLLQNGTEVARVESANALGVLQTSCAAAKTIIAVPWLSLTDDGNAIAVADLVKTAGLTAGDKLHVYNKAKGRYDVYELAADKTWTPKAIYKVGADGMVETASSGTPETTTVARGNGVWLERQDTTKPIVSYGAVASGTVATAIDAGTAEKPTWNLLAVPTTTAVNIATAFGTDAADKIIVPTYGAPKICTVKDGAWGYEKSEPVTDESGNKLGVKIVRETVTELPAGTGFWFLNGGTAKTVNW